MLLQAQQHAHTALNVAAIMILSIGTICFGENALSREYLTLGVQMAEQLGLMGERRCSKDSFLGSQEELSVHKYSAWGAFNFSV